MTVLTAHARADPYDPGDDKPRHAREGEGLRGLAEDARQPLGEDLRRAVHRRMEDGVAQIGGQCELSIEDDDTPS